MSLPPPFFPTLFPDSPLCYPFHGFPLSSHSLSTQLFQISQYYCPALFIRFFSIFFTYSDSLHSLPPQTPRCFLSHQRSAPLPTFFGNFFLLEEAPFLLYSLLRFPPTLPLKILISLLFPYHLGEIPGFFSVRILLSPTTKITALPLRMSSGLPSVPFLRASIYLSFLVVFEGQIKSLFFIIFFFFVPPLLFF